MTSEARYRFGVQWIADNDEPGSLDINEISGYISTLLLADLFNRDPIQVAESIRRARVLKLRADQIANARRG